MGKPFHLAGTVVMALLLCPVGFAQRGRVGGARSAPARSFSSSHFSPGVRGVQIQPATRSFSYGYTPAGLPFYYPNLPPLNGNFRTGPSGFGSRGRGRGGRGTYFFWGGVPYYYDGCLDTYINCLDESGDQEGYAAAATQAPGPQVVVIQQAAPAAAPSANNADQGDPAAAPSTAAPAPAPDNTGFALIRRDGQVVFASAYSVIGTNIRYVTPEGTIRTMPLADLDIDSTRSINEARGVALFPNQQPAGQ